MTEGADADVAVAHQLGVTQKNIMTVNSSAHPVSGNGGEAFRIGDFDVTSLCSFDDGFAERVLRAAFERSGKAKYVLFFASTCDDDIRQSRLAAGGPM